MKLKEGTKARSRFKEVYFKGAHKKAFSSTPFTPLLVIQVI